MTSEIIDEMVRSGMLQRLDPQELDTFLSGDGLRVLFFTGSGKRSREAHDVAVALREMIRDYRGLLRAAIISEDEAALQSRFRVMVLPSLVLTLGGETLEVLPGIKDWGEYAAAFLRYLGAAPTNEPMEQGAA